MRRLLPVLAVLLLAGCGGGGSTTTTHHHHAPVHQKGYQTPYGLSAHNPNFGKHPKNLPLPPHLSPTAASNTLTMLDSVDTKANSSTWNGISTPPVVAGYLPPSSWPTFTPFITEFPHSTHVAVAVRSYTYGDHRAAITCLDDEPGDATPSEAGPWVAHEVKLGFRPCVYESMSELPAIKSSIAAAHVHAHVYFWCADWTYYAHLTAGCDATQWTDHYSGQNIDGSVVDREFVNATPPKPTTRCYHKGWPVPVSDKALCLKVRAHDAFLGRQRAKEAGYLKVTNQNIAAIQAKLSPIQSKLGNIEKRAAGELSKHHWVQLKVSATNAIPLAAQAGPLEAQLGPLQANAKLEQSKEKSFDSQLQADLKKYGFKK